MISIKLIIFLCLFFAINGSSIVAREKVVGKSKNVKEDNWNKGQSFDKGAIESFSNDRQPETREVAKCVFSFTSNGGIISLFMVTYEGRVARALCLVFSCSCPCFEFSVSWEFHSKL